MLIILNVGLYNFVEVNIEEDSYKRNKKDTKCINKCINPLNFLKARNNDWLDDHKNDATN